MAGDDFKSLFEFAKAEFFEVARERSQLRLLAIAIMGAVIPIFVSLLFQFTGNAQITPYDVLSLSLIGLSFVFLLLGHTFIGRSRRHDELVTHLRNMHGEFPRYLNLPKEEEKAPTRKNLIAEYTSTMCEFMIFIVPSASCMIVAVTILLFLQTDWPLYIACVWSLFLAADGILFAAICYRWSEGVKWRKVPLSTYLLAFFSYCHALFARGLGISTTLLHDTEGALRVNWEKWRNWISSRF